MVKDLPTHGLACAVLRACLRLPKPEYGREFHPAMTAKKAFSILHICLRAIGRVSVEQTKIKIKAFLWYSLLSTGLLSRASPASRARRSTASGNESPSVSITKSKILPFLPAEKSNQAIFWSLTKKDGV